MEILLLVVGLALGTSVLLQVLDELVPVRLPAALSRTVAVLATAGVAWALDWSVLTALGQDVREAWMHPVATGLVLVGVAELVRSLVAAIAGSRGASEPATPSAGARREVRAA